MPGSISVDRKLALEASQANPFPLSEAGMDVLRLPSSILDHLPIGVCICGRDGQIIRYNRAAAEIWGRSPALEDGSDRFCGAARLHRIDGGPLLHALSPMGRVLTTGVPVRNEEVVMERPDGKRLTALLNIDPVRDQFGIVVGAVNCFRDISEFSRRRGGTLEDDRLAHELLEALPVAVYTTDRAGVITFYNRAAAEFWGRHPTLGLEEWCGSHRLFWPDGTAMAHSECPMAITLKEGRPIRGVEAVAERPDGTRVAFIPFPTPLFDHAGMLVGAVNALVDITHAKRDFEAAQRLVSIVESSRDAIVSKDLDGVIKSWNKGAERLFGYMAEEVLGKSITILIPDDRFDEEAVILGRIRSGEHVDHYETVRRRKDGSLVDISLTVSPIRDARGNIVGASKIARDITERRRAEERQRVLLREMNHRVKNLFALASGVVSLSSRSAASPEELVKAIRDRLGALSRAHSLTLPDVPGGEGADNRATTIEALAKTIVRPYEIDDDGTRVRLIGPEIEVGGAAVTSLALLLNEFAANAAKYGAFSAPGGIVTIGWRIEGEELRLDWIEKGGPKVGNGGTNEGFGSVLARATVQGQFGGRIDRDWRPEGLRIHLSVPLARLTPS